MQASPPVRQAPLRKGKLLTGTEVHSCLLDIETCTIVGMYVKYMYVE